MTVDEMLHRCTGEELTEWMAFDSMEPIGGHRIDFAAGIIASTIAHKDRPKNRPRIPFETFTPFIKKQSEPMDPMDAFHVLLAMAQRKAT